MEAYGVLSVSESRANYDLMKRKNPDAYREISQAEFDRRYSVDKRDEAGNTPIASPKAGSYAETRLKELKEQRKKYNVDDFGYYRGGLPQKKKGPVRGNSLGRPGYFHQPSVHNFLNNYHADAKLVDSEDAVKFGAWMQSDKVDFQQTKPSHPMYYDRDLDFMKDRSFWLRMILLSLFGLWVWGKYGVERARWMRWERVEKIEDLPEHHFHNRGGVLVKKQFAGFEKIHKNKEEVVNWYRKAYPNLF